jgi:hypothetical protein
MMLQGPASAGPFRNGLRADRPKEAAFPGRRKGTALIDRRRMLATAAALLVPVTGAARAAPAAPRPFMFVSPATVESLAGMKAAPAAAAAMRWGDRALARSVQARSTIRVEGLLPTDPDYRESAEAKRDWWLARDLALAGALAGGGPHQERAAAMVQAWFDIYETRYNPIDDAGLDDLLLASDLLLPAFRGAADARRDDLLRRLCDGYLERPLKGGSALNNWNSHRVKLIALAAFGLGDERRIMKARRAFEAQLLVNIEADGTTFDFRQRDAIHYVIYTLEPLLKTAYAARRHGLDWYRLAEGRLPAAVAWLRPYADGTRTHQEFVRTRVNFDRVRAEAGVPGFSGPFRPDKAKSVMTLAARFERRHAPLAGILPWLDLVDPL